MARIDIRAVDVMAEASWSWDSPDPLWRNEANTTARRFDPFPAYAHRREWIEQTAREVQQACPPLWDVDLYYADREIVGRTNGYSSVYEDRKYVDGKWELGDKPRGLIMLSGKRTPIHPAMTRFVVAHEYGHNVEYMLERVAGSKHLHEGSVVREFAKMRLLPESSLHYGGGGRWHDSATEIFADDFRILICRVELEHWPHQGIAEPDIKMIGWWAEQMAKLARYREGIHDDVGSASNGSAGS